LSADAPARWRQIAAPLALAILGATIYVAARATRDLSDFAVYHTAAVRGAAAAPLYRPDDGHFQFKYLPAFAVALAPLAPVPVEIVKAGWFGLMFAALVLFLRQSLHALPAPRTPRQQLTWLVLLVMAKFYLRELTLGQTNVLLGALAVTTLVAAAGRRPVAAGAAAGAAVFVKPYAVLLLPWLAVAAGLTALLAAAGVLAAGLTLPAAVYGWGGNLDLLAGWYRTVTDTTAPNLLLPENVSFASAWAKWAGPGPLAGLLAALTGVAGLALAMAIWARRRTVAEPAYLEVSVLLLLVPLLSPQGWDYVLLLGTPAVALLLDRWRETPFGWRAAIGVVLVLMSLPLRDLLGLAVYRHAMATGFLTAGALVLLVATARLRFRGLA